MVLNCAEYWCKCAPRMEHDTAVSVFHFWNHSAYYATNTKLSQISKSLSLWILWQKYVCPCTIIQVKQIVLNGTLKGMKSSFSSLCGINRTSAGSAANYCLQWANFTLHHSYIWIHKRKKKNTWQIRMSHQARSERMKLPPSYLIPVKREIDQEFGLLIPSKLLSYHTFPNLSWSIFHWDLMAAKSSHKIPCLRSAGCNGLPQVPPTRFEIPWPYM
jgi:hypothetical protein